MHVGRVDTAGWPPTHREHGERPSQRGTERDTHSDKDRDREGHWEGERKAETESDTDARTHTHKESTYLDGPCEHVVCLVQAAAVPLVHGVVAQVVHVVRVRGQRPLKVLPDELVVVADARQVPRVDPLPRRAL